MLFTLTFIRLLAWSLCCEFCPTLYLAAHHSRPRSVHQCTTIQLVNRAKGWRSKHTKTHRQRHGSSLKQEFPKIAPFIVSRGNLYRDSLAPAKRTRNYSPAFRPPEGLVLRAAVGTQIRGKQVVDKKFRIWGFTASNNTSTQDLK